MSEAILPGDPPLRVQRSRSEQRRDVAGAAFASVAVHALFIALLIGLWHPQPDESAPPPIPVTLKVEQTGASGASGQGHNVIAGTAAGGAAASPATPAAPSQPQAETVTAPLQTAVAPTPVPAPPQPPAAADVPPTATAALEPVPPRKPAPPRPQPMIAQAQPPPQPVQAAPPQAPSPAPAATPSIAAQSSNAVAQQDAGGRGRGVEGAGRAVVGYGSLEGLGDDYLEQVRRWVARYQKMPDEAAKQKQYGTAFVTVVIDRVGNVLDAWIDKTSGYPSLDEATLKMVHDASPLPKVPDAYKGAELKIGIPSNYRPGIFERLFR